MVLIEVKSVFYCFFVVVFLHLFHQLDITDIFSKY